MSTFENFGLHQNIITAVNELGFETPTPIQSETIPHLMSSHQDIIATAQTGTGIKTGPAEGLGENWSGSRRKWMGFDTKRVEG